MLDTAKQIAETLRDKLRSYDDFVGLYLYGSQVTEAATHESDIDIVAVFESDMYGDEPPLRDVWDFEVENDVVIDFHPFSLKQLNTDKLYFDEVRKGVYYVR